jgi:histidine triad (HIT) family protein
VDSAKEGKTVSQSECIFCRIAAGELPAAIVHETQDVLAFRDVRPQAPRHVLVIPRRHIASVNDLEPGDAQLMGQLLLAAKAVAAAEGVGESGYRLVLNTGAEGGQVVGHIHMHVLGGRQMRWPPG